MLSLRKQGPGVQGAEGFGAHHVSPGKLRRVLLVVPYLPSIAVGTGTQASGLSGSRGGTKDTRWNWLSPAPYISAKLAHH